VSYILSNFWILQQNHSLHVDYNNVSKNTTNGKYHVYEFKALDLENEISKVTPQKKCFIYNCIKHFFLYNNIVKY